MDTISIADLMNALLEILVFIYQVAYQNSLAVLANLIGLLIPS